MTEPIDRYAARMRHLFDHGDMSFHLAKLLEETGELAQAVNKDRPRLVVYSEVADVVLSALLIGAVYRESFRNDDNSYPNLDDIIEEKLKHLENDSSYRDFQPPERKTDRRS